LPKNQKSQLLWMSKMPVFKNRGGRVSRISPKPNFYDPLHFFQTVAGSETEQVGLIDCLVVTAFFLLL